MIGDWTIKVTHGREQPYSAWREETIGSVLYWFHVSAEGLERNIDQWCKREPRPPRVKKEWEAIGSLEAGRA